VRHQFETPLAEADDEVVIAIGVGPGTEAAESQAEG
jgi:hypothetical protein